MALITKISTHQLLFTSISILQIINVMTNKQQADSIHTVSLARSSGSSRPRDCLYKSRSQHRAREAPKCLNPSMHCNMIFSANQSTPYLFQERKRLEILFRSLYSRKAPYGGKDQNQPFNHFQLVLSLVQMPKVVEILTRDLFPGMKVKCSMPSETARYPQSYKKHITSNSCRTAGQSASYFSQDMDISSDV